MMSEIEDSLWQDRRESQCKVYFLLYSFSNPLTRPWGMSFAIHLKFFMHFYKNGQLSISKNRFAITLTMMYG